MKYKIIASSSKGNCYLFEDSILLDVGIPFNKLKESIDINKIKYVLLTHRHRDHFNQDAIRKLYINNKNIKFICGMHLLRELLYINIPKKNIAIVKSGNKYKLNEIIVVPISLYHDVPNFGYRLIKDKYKHLHITDTAHLRGITAKNYDSATLECNHCEIKAKEIIEFKNYIGEFTHLKGALNSHLSVQQAIQFIKANKIKKLIPCHIGDSTKKEVLERLNEAGL